jgi:hypothetical protein
MDIADFNLRNIIRILVDPKTSDQDRWLMRLTLLQVAGVEATTEALAYLGNTTPEKVMGAMAVLQTDGHVWHEVVE